MQEIIHKYTSACNRNLSPSLASARNSTAKPIIAGQKETNLYYDSGYALPLHLMQPAYVIKEMLLKPNKASMARVFKQIAYICITGEKRICYKSQTNLGLGCGRFEGKAITRKQVGRLERKLCESFQLFDRSRFNSEESYDRALNPLGTVVYLLLTGAVKYKPSEKMSQPKTKNVPTQFLRQVETIYLNTTDPASKEDPPKPKRENALALKVEEKTGVHLSDLTSQFRFDVEFRKQRHENVKAAKSQMTQIRQLLRKL